MYLVTPSLMFLTCWGKLVEMSTVGSGGPVLATFTELCCLLDRFAMGAVPSCPRRQQPHPAATLHRMWTSLGHRFTTVVGEVSSQSLHGSFQFSYGGEGGGKEVCVMSVVIIIFYRLSQ